MKILLLCKKFPFPAKDGEAIAIMHFIKSFSNLGHEVSVLAINTIKHHFNMELLPKEIKKLALFESVNLDTSVTWYGALFNLFSNKSYNIQRFVSSKYNNSLIDLLEKNNFDVVQLEGLYLCPYISTIRQYSSALVALRTHNIEFEIWERLAKNQSNYLKKWYYKLLSRRLENYESKQLNIPDVMIPISTKDGDRLKELGSNIPQHIAPTGIKVDYPIGETSEKVNNRICFIGALDWLPNQEGLRWFLDSVWPKLIEENNSLELYVAGRNFPKEWKDLQKPNVYMIGEVDDALEFLRNKSILIVPLLSGSGIRIKILESMAQAKVVVSTSIGAEGIVGEHGKNIFIADSPEAFKNCILECVGNNALYNNVQQCAINTIKDNYDADVIASDLISFYELQVRK